MTALKVIDRQSKGAKAKDKTYVQYARLFDENGKEVKSLVLMLRLLFHFRLAILLQYAMVKRLVLVMYWLKTTESLKTRDITGGLPRVAGYFEARVPKAAGMLAPLWVQLAS